jgi:hypothetical protein
VNTQIVVDISFEAMSVGNTDNRFLRELVHSHLIAIRELGLKNTTTTPTVSCRPKSDPG